MPSLRSPRFLLACAGILCVALGTLGIVIPGLPTTPFLLAASYFFARSSPRLQRWLSEHRWFGPYLRAIRDERALPLRGKIITLVLLWTSIGVSLWWLHRDGDSHVALTVFLLVSACGVTWLVFFVFRTQSRDPGSRALTPGPGAGDQEVTVPAMASSGASAPAAPSVSDGESADAASRVPPAGPSAPEGSESTNGS